jgi:mono/diheme cytochrome c family protein
MRASALLFGLALLLAAAAHGAAPSGKMDTAKLARGRYLARLGDCRACHTQPGHPAFSGGRPIKTPFGTVYTPNLTPDKATGIGVWNAADFYRAMHNGIGLHGRYLYPVFPFPAYTKLSRKDVNAIWAYLRGVKPVHRRNRPPALRWPYRMRSTLRLWRLLYFKPGAFKPDPDRSALWNRGAYLVRGLTHCGACHTPRNRWGARIDKQALAGGTVPIETVWHAPNITPDRRTGIGKWSAKALQRFLKTGRSKRGAALGPMRDVVQSSLQYLKQRDLKAIVAYLQNVPARTSTRTAGAKSPMRKQSLAKGKALYHQHCANCHGDNGRAKHAFYPDLRDNRIVLARDPTNLILIMLRGGFEASTAAYPYPYSMPPFGVRLSNNEIAAIADYVRRNWKHRASAPVQPRQVGGLR